MLQYLGCECTKLEKSLEFTASTTNCQILMRWTKFKQILVKGTYQFFARLSSLLIWIIFMLLVIFQGHPEESVVSTLFLDCDETVDQSKVCEFIESLLLTPHQHLNGLFRGYTRSYLRLSRLTYTWKILAGLKTLWKLTRILNSC